MLNDHGGVSYVNMSLTGTRKSIDFALH